MLEDVVLWEKDGEILLSEKHPNGNIRAVGVNLEYIFKEGVTWSPITSALFSSRLLPPGCLFSSASNTLFSSAGDVYALLGQTNSNVFEYFSKIINPTLNLNTGDVANIPIIEDKFISMQIAEQVKILVDLHKRDWNFREISTAFDFNYLIVRPAQDFLMRTSWDIYRRDCDASIKSSLISEGVINKLVIEGFGLQDDFMPEVSESQIALARADREKDCQRLMSYAIGCMMGRYSLDAPGLIYARAGNVGFDTSHYTTYPADADGIVPLTEEFWFDDDAASRIHEFLLAVWGADTLTENMAWLAESLGTKASETPDETIRRYLADKFYKDHLQTYKKRPIYWLFSSGKQGAFQALVYLHRYHEGTLARLRAEYVVPLTGKFQSRIDMLQKDTAAASSTAARNKLAKEVEKLKKKHVELLAYDEQLRHHADMRITLDLDDGVKVNYGKFGDLLADVKFVTGGAGDD